MQNIELKPISGPYRGYDQRVTPAPDLDLTRVGPGTPMGELQRRFWQPVCFSSQLTDLPRVVRILGEDLVAFRTKAGSVGVLHKHCAHRGTSLEYGRIEEDGLRCCYHGWKFGCDGTVLDTPAEPLNSRLKKAVFQGAYPAMEYHGLVHVYMGPPDQKPAFPEFDVFQIPGLKYHVSSVLHANNWLQSFENNMDPFHGQFLHTRVTLQPHFGEHYFVLPQVEWKVTEDGRGMYYIAMRRVNDDTLWARMFHVIFPNYVFVASLYDLLDEVPFFQRTFWVRRVVPVDDEHSTFFSWRLAAEQGEFAGGDVKRNGWNSIDFDGQVEQSTYEAKQRAPGDWEAQTGQRSIAVHKLERLGTTDAGVVKLRNGLRDMLAGKVALPPNAGSLGTKVPENVYSSNNVFKIRRLEDPAADVEQTRNVSRALAAVVVEADAAPTADRRRLIIERLQAIEREYAR